MVKLRHKGLLVLGINKKELDALRDGAPLPIELVDLHPSLKGQHILIIPGSDDKMLMRIMTNVADSYEQGATSIIEIAKQIPKGRVQ